MWVSIFSCAAICSYLNPNEGQIATGELLVFSISARAGVVQIVLEAIALKALQMRQNARGYFREFHSADSFSIGVATIRLWTMRHITAPLLPLHFLHKTIVSSACSRLFNRSVLGDQLAA